MRDLLSILLFILLLASCETTSKNKTAVLSEPMTALKENIDEYFTALNTMGTFNGVVFASKHDTLLIHKAYNLNADSQSSTYITKASQFDIHSVSKLMAHYLIEKFERDGKLKKSDAITRFIPDFPKGENITIGMLLNHSSGLPRGFENMKDNGIDLTSEQIIAYTKLQPLLFEPGTDTQYSNVAYELVYYIIEQISHKPFAQCLHDELFLPLGMTNSGAHFYLKDSKPNNLAKNHEKKDTLIVQVDNILPEELKTARVFSTALDLNIFLNHIKKEPYASLLKNETDVIEKSGGSDGIRVEIYTNLKDDYNFIFLANYEEVPFLKTVEDFAKILEGRPYDVPKALHRKAIQLAPDLLERYAGSYVFPDMKDLELTIKIDDTYLVVYQDDEQIATLMAESENTFFEDPKAPESFEFMTDANGKHYTLMGFKGIKLKGIKQEK